MTTVINTTPTNVLPVICDFGWYYNVSGTNYRTPRYAYSEGSTLYPPGYTTLKINTALNQSPPFTVPTNFTTLAALQAAFDSVGTITFVNVSLPSGNVTGLGSTFSYSGLGLVGGIPSFTGCVSTYVNTVTAGTPMVDTRFYMDSAPLVTNIVLDAVDNHSFGLPTVVAPSGVSIMGYQWDLGNGVQGWGPQTTILYNYTQPPAGLQVRLTVIDSLGRTFSCAHRLNLVYLNPVYGTEYRANRRGMAPVAMTGGTQRFSGTLATVKSGP